MTDMENDNIEEKKSWYAALREKHSQEMSALQAKLDEQIALRQADKKLYFENTMKSKGYSWDFSGFTDKYGNLDLNDMVSLYVWQNGWATTANVSDVPTSMSNEAENLWAKSVIAWANPTAEVGTKTLDDMSPDELIKYAKTQSWYNN